jgi:hypothetical protein
MVITTAAAQNVAARIAHQEIVTATADQRTTIAAQ